ncbi:hypothetical protein DPMN_130787 [Dreissena polymorpha]|uniref:Uncharacterized protein n=1 Tax=Dreissena polymorpha TaxID=45954 RepID=A0A9D4H578_DREPO|nr:hypothetical protein DPMN_130787 [Dreissena polymorpha]
MSFQDGNVYNESACAWEEVLSEFIRIDPNEKTIFTLEDYTILVVRLQRMDEFVGSYWFFPGNGHDSLPVIVINCMKYEVEEVEVEDSKYTPQYALELRRHKKCPTPGGHVFQPTQTIFELVQDIIATNLMTKFLKVGHNVASKVKNTPPPGGRVFQPTGTILNLSNISLAQIFRENFMKI